MARPLASVLLGLLAVGTAARAHAQLRRETEPVMLPPMAVSAPDGPFALSINPAALTGLPSWNVAYVHAGGPNDDEAKDRGDAGYAAMPLPFGFAAALSVEHRRGGLPYGASTQFALGGAYGHTPRFSVGFAVRHIEGGSVDGATTVDLAILVRRSRLFAFSLVGYDLLGPVSLVGLNGLSVPLVGLGAFTVRPLGDDHLTLEGFGAVSNDGRVGFGGLASVGLVHGTRIAARTTVEHFRYQREVRVVVGAELPWDRFSALAGGVVGDGYTDDHTGWYAGAIVGERPTQSLPGLSVVREVVVRGAVGTRDILGLIDDLQRAANDPRVAGVLLRLPDTRLPLAYAQELRQAIETVRLAEKPVFCHVGSAATPVLYACSAADRTLLVPGAVVRLRAPAFELIPAKDALAAAGIEADVVARGTHGPGAYAADEQALGEDARGRLLADLARSLEISTSEVAALVRAGELGTSEAVETPLVDGTARDGEIDDALEDATGRRVRRRTADEPFGPRAWTRPRRVAVVVLDAPFVDGEGGEGMAGHIERLARNRAVGAIVVRVDSGGGSMVAADRISTALRAARDRKPVIASIGARATSGAYLVASACDEIFTSPASVTGGFTLFFARVDAPGADEYEPFSPAEREALAPRLAMAERGMIERIAEDRSLRAESIERIDGGAFYSGDEALRLGLADHLGGFAAAVARARELGRVAPNVELSFEPAPSRTVEAGRASEARLRAREIEQAVTALGRETALAIAPAVVLTP